MNDSIGPFLYKKTAKIKKCRPPSRDIYSRGTKTLAPRVPGYVYIYMYIYMVVESIMIFFEICQRLALEDM